MRRRSLRGWAPVLLAGLLAGCGQRAIEARATLPAARPSRPLTIYTRDSYPRLLNANTARIVSARDGALTFHVQVTDLDPIAVDPDRWSVWLEDDAGNRIAAPVREAAMRVRLSVEFRPVQRTVDGPVILVKRDRPGDAYVGEATYEFSGVSLRDRPVTLVVLRRPDDLQLRWRWQVADREVYQDYGMTPADRKEGYQPLPGAVSRVASTEKLH